MKPVVSPGAKRAALFLVGLIGVVVTAVLELVQQSGKLSWQSLAMTGFAAAAAYALKYSGDRDEAEVRDLVEKELVEMLHRLFPGTRPVDLDDTLPGLGPKLDPSNVTK